MTLARGRFGYRSRALRRSTVEVVHGANVTVTLQCGSPVAKTVTPIAPVSGAGLGSRSGLCLLLD
jgi:hypothetical protein